MKMYLIPSLFILCINLSAQTPMTYEDQRGNTHLCGPITIEDLQEEPYKTWYDENYASIDLIHKAPEWQSNLDDTTVDIYLGTWCGDSKRNVPKFIKLWEELGLNIGQINIIALYNGAKTKQGPDSEEQGKKIHRVPTFIFKKEGKEYARIVEKPVTSLETDIAQIALGYPSTPSYAGANYLIDLLERESIDDIRSTYKTHINATYRLTSKSNELNTLGYVLLAADRIEEAILTFEFNTRYFPDNPNVYDSYAEGLAAGGRIEEAIKYYKKAYKMDPENKNARAQIKKLRRKENL